jgi:tetratricopeptide (TPR) repeat protein
MAEARCVILEGRVADGLLLLHEAGVAIASGELEPLITGVLYCELVCALQSVAQYDLAEEWTAAMERWCHGQPVGSIHGRCRVHRAEILRLRGAYREAEEHALGACEELRPYLRRELGWPLMELGRIRLRRGDLQGAQEAFRAAHEVGWDPQPGLALVQLERGEVARASDSIRDALEHPLSNPSKELPPYTELRRAPLLEAQAEIAVAAGDLPLAQHAADELGRIAASFDSRPLTASAALASARVLLARGDTGGACREFDRAAGLWNEVGAPHETALARRGLGQAHRAAGNEARALLELEAARAGFERLGAVREASAAATENVFRREGDYWSLAFAGRTVRLQDLKGLHYLARLLGTPGREFHVLDLVAAQRGPDAGDAGPLLDAEAKAAYGRRLAEIDEDLAEAQQIGDARRVEQARVERDFLAREIARAVGLGGRDRRASSDSERARAGVTRAIRSAMARIREHHAPLADHLERAIRTGTACGYHPDPRAPACWML